jgi:hypothetical protein
VRKVSVGTRENHCSARAYGSRRGRGSKPRLPVNVDELNRTGGIIGLLRILLAIGIGVAFIGKRGLLKNRYGVDGDKRSD